MENYYNNSIHMHLPPVFGGGWGRLYPLQGILQGKQRLLQILQYACGG